MGRVKDTVTSFLLIANILRNRAGVCGQLVHASGVACKPSSVAGQDPRYFRGRLRPSDT